MIRRLHHVGIGVKDLDETIQFYTDVLGLEVIGRVSWPGLEAALVSVGGVILELIEPLEPQTRVAESLYELVQERGGGVHHICLEVDDIEVEVEALKAKGVRMIGRVPQEVAGGQIAWLDEDTLSEIMIELCQEGYQIK